jgi:hypothetical protein
VGSIAHQTIFELGGVESSAILENHVGVHQQQVIRAGPVGTLFQSECPIITEIAKWLLDHSTRNRFLFEILFDKFDRIIRASGITNTITVDYRDD